MSKGKRTMILYINPSKFNSKHFPEMKILKEISHWDWSRHCKEMLEQLFGENIDKWLTMIEEGNADNDSNN